MAVAIGKLDALFFILGVFGGIFLFGVSAPSIAHFNVSGAMGGLTLPVWLNLNTGIVVLAVILMAVGAFWAGSGARASGAPSRGFMESTLKEMIGA